MSDASSLGAAASASDPVTILARLWCRAEGNDPDDTISDAGHTVLDGLFALDSAAMDAIRQAEQELRAALPPAVPESVRRLSEALQHSLMLATPDHARERYRIEITCPGLVSMQEMHNALVSLRKGEEVFEAESVRWREALAPFVAHYAPWMDDPRWTDDEGCGCYARVTFGDLRRARTLLAAHPAGRVDEGGGWHQPAEIPAVGRKRVRLYEDGSGAVLLIRHDGGEIDCEGNEYELHRTLKPGPWAYTPRGYRFWCEDHGDDLVTLPEPGPADPWRKVLRDLLAEHDRNICLHEETHRGGAIWTICDHCGRKWADDEGGFTPYEEPRAVTAAWALLKSEEIDAAPAPPAPPSAGET